MSEDVLVDTHALLWWHADRSQLSAAAAAAMSGAELIFVSPITFWEVGMLRSKGRIELDRPTVAWANDVLSEQSFEEVALTTEIAILASELSDFHGDPADRIIAATAMTHGVALITKDHGISEWSEKSGSLQCVW